MIFYFSYLQDSYIANEWLTTEDITLEELAQVVNTVSQPIGNDEATWLANATSYYNTIDPTFTVITVQQVFISLYLYIILY